jgi:dTDP-4-amino-4,6-dideoxygalactose transaminase
MPEIKFIDLYAQYLSLKKEIDFAISEVINKSEYVRGYFVEKFEEEFANITNSEYCVSCANGTDSLFIAMKALGVQPGDEVLVPAQTWISTSETVSLAGGKPVFCDINLDNFTINIEEIKNKITSRTVGIIPVHLYGHSAEMATISKISKEKKLWVIEDCAQAHLCRYSGKQVGGFGDIASYSFYPSKNLGAMGDAGALTTNNRDLAEKMARFARHGGLNKGEHDIEGMNSRLDGIQAAVLSVKLTKLHEWTHKRKIIANNYKKMMSDNRSIRLPMETSGVEHVWHLFVIMHEKRNELKEYLKQNGIPTLINYPVSLPFLPAYRHLAHSEKEFKVAYFTQQRILSLPLYPEMPEEHIEYIAKVINNFEAVK